MRVAMLSVTLHPKSRAANIARAMALIDAAAGSVVDASGPPPDLIVAPPGCDHLPDTRPVMTEAMSEMFAASMALKAREWGVRIAYGHHRCTRGGASDVAVLLDADGDEQQSVLAGIAPDRPAETEYGPLLLHMQAADAPRYSLPDLLPAAALTLLLGQAVIGEGKRDDGKSDAELCRRVSASNGSFVCLVRASAMTEGDAGWARFCPATQSTSRCDARPEGHVVTVDFPTSVDAGRQRRPDSPAAMQARRGGDLNGPTPATGPIR